MEKKLTAKEEKFCKEYLKDLNATQAAIRSGYAPNSANVTACRLLTKTNIAQRLKELQANVAERNDVTIDRIIKELALIAFSDMRTHFQNGKIVPIDQLTEEQSRAVASVKETSYTYADGSKKGTSEFRLHNKLDAIEKLCKHLGFYELDNKQKDQVVKIVVEHKKQEEPLMKAG